MTELVKEAQWVPLNLEPRLANTVEDIDRNIDSALQRTYIPFLELLGKKRGAVSIVGSGPSLKKNWQKMVKMGHEIIACNAACQFLLERGVVPQYMFCFDADPLMLEFITPHPDITYLMGSRCPPKAFDMLQDCKVVIWHAGGDENIEKLLNKHNRMEPMISGGTAAVTRSMLLAQAAGWSEIHLWGCDSSHSEGESHIRKSTTEERGIHVMVNNKVFVCSPWMCQQAEDFKILARPLRDQYNVDLVVHGDGIIPHLAYSMYFKTDLEWEITRLFRMFIAISRTLWKQL